MKYNSNTTVKGLNATLTFLFIMLNVAVSMAQPLNDSDAEEVVPVKNAWTMINYASNVSQLATAEAMIPTINSGFQELKPRISPEGNRLYFSRMNHPNNTGGVLDKEDIWFSSFNGSTGTWSDPARLQGFLNNKGPNYVEQVSTTGDTLILGNQYLKNGKMKDGISYSVNVNGVWSAPVAINIKGYYNLSTHGNHFVSMKAGVIIAAIETGDTKGQRDLYVSFWNGKTATTPLNMGGIINSEFEESSPYLAPDDKTLFFASKGHSGNGGYDIFMSQRLDDSWVNWSEPVNLGPAVNGPLDEEFFSISQSGQQAVFSKQITVHNVNLYEISTKDLFLPEKHAARFR